MKKIIKVIAIILLAQLLMSLNAADNSEHMNFHKWNELPEELKLKVLKFVSDSNYSDYSDDILKLEILERIRKLSSLVQVNTYLNATEIIRNALNERIAEYNLVIGNADLLKVALTLKTPFPAKWLKNKASKNKDIKIKIDQNLIAAAKKNILEKNILEIVEFLINAGADVNAKDGLGNTALIEAASNGYIDIVKFLVDNGADVNAKDFLECSALTWAAINGHIDIVKFLANNGADLIKENTALIEAARNGHIDIVKFLVNNGADVNVKDNLGRSALIWAAGNGHIDIVKFLVNNGADVNVKDDFSQLALICAAENGHIDIVKFLVNAKSSSVNIALTVANLKGHKDIVKFLSKK